MPHPLTSRCIVSLDSGVVAEEESVRATRNLVTMRYSQRLSRSSRASLRHLALVPPRMAAKGKGLVPLRLLSLMLNHGHPSPSGKNSNVPKRTVAC